MSKRVIWAVPLERYIPAECAVSLMNVAQRAGECGFDRISIGYARTDLARNNIALKFLELTQDGSPDDTLIMLDNDHNHPVDVLEKLAAHNAPVVGGLAFRRGEPYDACFYVKNPNGEGYNPAGEFESGLYVCDAIGHAAIAVQRRVFEKLGGEMFPWWRYRYTDGQQSFPSEDLWFSEIVKQAGFPIYCDTSIISPHFTSRWIDDKTWTQYAKEHPELLTRRDG